MDENKKKRADERATVTTMTDVMGASGSVGGVGMSVGSSPPACMLVSGTKRAFSARCARPWC
jgi:hypothetical protein